MDAGIPVVPGHSGMDHSARETLEWIQMESDPEKGKAIRTCFRRGENLIDVHNPSHLNEVMADLREKIVERFVQPGRGD